MTLKDDFYHIERHAAGEAQSFVFHVTLHREHFIYKAHFPGLPVTPGVCLIQMCKELMEEHVSAPLLLGKLVNVKFLAVINPDDCCRLQFTFTKVSTTDEGYKCTTTVESEAGVVFARLSICLRHAPTLDGRMREHGICVIIPTYNHAPFLEVLLPEILRHTSFIIVVDDGSTDRTPQLLSRYSGRITIVTHARNKGKGLALEHGICTALSMGYASAITIDSDGQHKASDLPSFVDAAIAHPSAMLIGSRSFHEENMPAGNKFANRLSNFWFAVQSGRCLPDTQCGYRLYPIGLMRGMRLFTGRYEAELEYLLRLAWRDIPLIPVQVDVSYLPKGERVSHYNASADFLRISMLNAIMFFVAILYGYPSRFIRRMLRRLHGRE
ncbi:MAG: glycosyltransferase [Tannerellaceae bacterium]|jgi:3-hydroxymyristoyl/3-hydroxydecanoyl-(acyl carrier protein) dehydratase|nr:glycosyltransferase [Tannerellaceae bacterium]